MEDAKAQTSPQSECDLSRLDWYDKTIVQSYDTCKVASPGVLLAVPIATFVLCAIFFQAAILGSPFSWRLTPPILVRAFFMTIVASPFTLLWAVFCLVPAFFAVAGLNSASGFAIKARTQIAISGGLASFFCLCPLLFVSGKATWWTMVFLVIGVTIGQLLAVLVATRSSTWLSWSSRKSIENKVRRHQFELKHFFYLTGCCAAACSVAAISTEFGIAVGVFLVLQLVLFLLDAAWMKVRVASTQYD